MKLVIFVLTLIGYCFDINSGCCGKGNNGNSKVCCKCCGGRNISAVGGIGSRGKKHKRSNPHKKNGKEDSLRKTLNPSKAGNLDFIKGKSGGPSRIAEPRTSSHDGGRSDVGKLKQLNKEYKKNEPVVKQCMPVKEIVITIDESNIYDKVVFKYEDGEEEVLGRNLKITCEKEVGFDVCYDISQYNIDDNVKVTCEIGEFYVVAIANLDNKNDIIICKTCKKNIDNDFSGCFSEYFEMVKSKTRYNYLKILAANINDACEIFEKCSRLKKLDLRNFDTSNISNMCNMFSFCYDLSEIIGLGRFNTSNVYNMWSMFYNCESLKSLDLSNFNTTKVTNMGSMFYNCESLKSLNLSNFNTSKVTDMSYMFYKCESLKSLNLSNFNTSKVKDMVKMFNECEMLESLDLSKFDTKKVTSMLEMFKGCKELKSLNLSSFDTSNVKCMDGIFRGCKKLMELDISSFKKLPFNTKNYVFGSGLKKVIINKSLKGVEREYLVNKFTREGFKEISKNILTRPDDAEDFIYSDEDDD